MTRLYIAGIMLAVLAAGGWYVARLIQQNAALEIALEGAAQTITQQAQDAEQREQINATLRQQREALSHDRNRLQRRLSGLRRTQAQRDCDVTDLPDGYIDGLQQYTNPQASEVNAR